MEKKFEMTNETLLKYGRTFHRIKALRKFNKVEEGEVGGWIEHEYNLSHDGGAWVADEALVYDNARILDDARIYDHAEAYANACVRNDATVRGSAQVYENATIGSHANICDARVHGDVRVFGSVEISGLADIYGNVCLKADTRISGSAEVFEENHVVSVTNILENDNTITFCRDSCGGILVMFGYSCMSLKDFDAKIATEYPDLDDSGVLSALVNLAERRIKKS